MPKKFPCGSCGIGVKFAGVRCTGLCHMWYHAACQNIIGKTLKTWSASQIENWKCGNCNISWNDSIETKTPLDSTLASESKTHHELNLSNNIINMTTYQETLDTINSTEIEESTRNIIRTLELSILENENSNNMLDPETSLTIAAEAGNALLIENSLLKQELHKLKQEKEFNYLEQEDRLKAFEAEFENLTITKANMEEEMTSEINLLKQKLTAQTHRLEAEMTDLETILNTTKKMYDNEKLLYGKQLERNKFLNGRLEVLEKTQDDINEENERLRKRLLELETLNSNKKALCENSKINHLEDLIQLYISVITDMEKEIEEQRTIIYEQNIKNEILEGALKDKDNKLAKEKEMSDKFSTKGKNLPSQTKNQLSAAKTNSSVLTSHKFRTLGNNVNPKLSIEGDSQGKGLVTNLDSLLQKDYQIYAHIQNGAPLEAITRATKIDRDYQKYSKRDYIVWIGGTNNVANNTFDNLPLAVDSLIKFITQESQKYNNTNLILATIPYRYDLKEKSRENQTICSINNHIRKLAHTYPHLHLLDLHLLTSRDHTRHGFHIGKRGKRVVAQSIKDIIRTNAYNCEPSTIQPQASRNKTSDFTLVSSLGRTSTLMTSPVTTLVVSTTDPRADVLIHHSPDLSPSALDNEKPSETQTNTTSQLPVNTYMDSFPPLQLGKYKKGYSGAVEDDDLTSQPVKDPAQICGNPSTSTESNKNLCSISSALPLVDDALPLNSLCKGHQPPT